MTIADPNAGASDTLTITLAGAGGALSGTGLSGGTGGVYTLAGTAATITSELEGLSFTPKAGLPGTSATTTFALSDLSSADSTAAVNTTTSVVDAEAPATVAYFQANQAALDALLGRKRRNVGAVEHDAARVRPQHAGHEID